MEYILGKIFFPMLMHQEKKLRARMRLLAIVCGLILVTGVAGLMWRLSKTQSRSSVKEKPAKVQNVQPPR